jgi:hypothetical protein
MEFGTTLGLARSFQADQRINDARYHDQDMKRAQNEAESKAKMLADDFDFVNAVNDFDNPRIKEYAKAHIQKTGKWLNENRGWESDVNKRMEYKMMIRELKDNPELNRGLASDTEFTKLSQYKSDPKNTHLVNAPEWQEIEAQRANYLKFGNQFARNEEEAQQLGQKSFVFTPPEEMFDVREHARKVGSTLGSESYYNANTGSGYKRVPEKFIKDEALALLEGPQARHYKNMWGKMTPQEKSFYGGGEGDITKWTEALVRAGTDKETKQGLPPDRSRAGSGTGQDMSMLNRVYLDIQAKNLQPGQVTSSPHIGVLAPLAKNVDGKTELNTDSPMMYQKDDGTWKEIKTFSGIPGIRAAATNKYTLGPSGELMTEVVVHAPINYNKENFYRFKDSYIADNEELFGEDGLFHSNTLFGWEWTRDPENIKNKPGMEKIANYNPETRMATLRMFVPANTDPAHLHQYNVKNHGQKEGNDQMMFMEAVNAQQMQQGKVQLARNEIAKLTVRTGTHNGRQVAELKDGRIVDLQTGSVIE